MKFHTTVATVMIACCGAMSPLLTPLRLIAQPLLGEQKADKPPHVFGPEIANYPDLFRVERTLNRLPFQRFHSISSAAWLAGGKRLAIADRSGITVWDVPRRRLVNNVPSRQVNTNHVANVNGDRLFVKHPDLGGVLISWPEQRVVQQFEAAKKAMSELGLMKLGLGRIRRASPDGSHLAVCYEKSANHHNLTFLDSLSGELTGERAGPPMPCLAWRPDSKLLAVGENRGIIIFLRPNGDLVRPGIRLDPKESPQSVAFSPDGKRLVVAGRESLAVYEMDGRKRLWYVGPKTASKEQPKRSHRHVVFSADGSELITAQYRRHDIQFLLAYSAKTGELLREKQISTSFPSVFEVSPDRKTIAFLASNYRVGLCDAATFEPHVVKTSAWNGDNISGDRNFPVDLSPSHQGSKIVSVGAGSVTAWDIEGDRQIWARSWPTWIQEAVWAPGDEFVATVRGTVGSKTPADEKAAVLLLASETGKTLTEIPLDGRHAGPVLVLDNKQIVACDNHSVYLLSAQGERVWKQQLVDGHTELSGLAINPSQDLLAVVTCLSGIQNLPHSGFSNGSIHVLQISNGEKQRELLSPTTPEVVSFSEDGSHVIASTNNHPRRRGGVQALVESWNVETGEIVDNPNIPNDGEVDFVKRTADGRRVATEYPLASSNQLIVDGVMSLSPDRRYMLIHKPIEFTEPAAEQYPNWSARLVLWDLREDKEITRWVIPNDLWDCAILPDGRVATLNHNGTIFVLKQ